MRGLTPDSPSFCERAVAGETADQGNPAGTGLPFPYRIESTVQIDDHRAAGTRVLDDM
jgi:hypothetical protein